MSSLSCFNLLSGQLPFFLDFYPAGRPLTSTQKSIYVFSPQAISPLTQRITRFSYLTSIHGEKYISLVLQCYVLVLKATTICFWFAWTSQTDIYSNQVWAVSSSFWWSYDTCSLSLSLSLSVSHTHTHTLNHVWVFLIPWTVARLLCPWNSPGKNTGMCSHSFLQGIFPTQGLNQGLLHCRQILCYLSHQGRCPSLTQPHKITGVSWVQ